MRYDITPEEVDSIMEKDHVFALANPNWARDNIPLPSRINTLSYIAGGNKKKAYARSMLHLRSGEYVSPERMHFDTQKMTYYFINPHPHEHTQEY